MARPQSRQGRHSRSCDRLQQQQQDRLRPLAFVGAFSSTKVSNRNHQNNALQPPSPPFCSGLDSRTACFAFPGSRFLKRPIENLAATSASPGPSIALTVAALVLGYLVGRLKKRVDPARMSNAPEMSDEKAIPLPKESARLLADMTDLEDPEALLEDNSNNIMVAAAAEDIGVTPVWLNYALSRMWALFQKNTKRLIQDTIQPVLDESDKPPFVKRVTVQKFVPGRQSPFVKALKRLPSRALAQVQYSTQLKFSSTSTIEFEMELGLEDSNSTMFRVPVTLYDLDVDSTFWASVQLAPYEPFVTSIEMALLKPPVVSFDIVIFKFIPLSTIPILGNFFYRVVTQEIPKEFLYPNLKTLDFTPEGLVNDRVGMAHPTQVKNDKKGKRTDTQELVKFDFERDQITQEELKSSFPEQYALFDALDLDGSGSLSAEELFSGLKDWGYTSADSSECFDRLDIDGDEKITLSEFCQIWPKLTEEFVPSRYKGLLTVFLRRAEDIPYQQLPQRLRQQITKTLFGSTAAYPYAQLELGERTVSSKRDRKTFRRRQLEQENEDNVFRNPVFMESFELNCMDVANEELEIRILEGGKLPSRRKRRRDGPKPTIKDEEVFVLGSTTISLKNLMRKPREQLKVNLKPEGTVYLDLYYSDFFDTRD